MENTKQKIDDLIGQVESFGKTTFELYKLRATDISIKVVTLTLSKICVIGVLVFFLFALTIGVSLFLGNLLGNFYIGFFIVSGFYLLLGVILHFFLHKWIKKPIAELIIKQVMP